VVFNLEDVFVLAVPDTSTNFDEKEEALRRDRVSLSLLSRRGRRLRNL